MLLNFTDFWKWRNSVTISLQYFETIGVKNASC